MAGRYEPDESLLCPTDLESSEGFYDPAGYEGTDGELACAGCGADKGEHTKAPEPPAEPATARCL